MRWAPMPERLDEDGHVERMCRKCRDWWGLDQFAKSKLCTGGRSFSCYACRNEYRAERRKAGKRRAA